MIKVGKEIRALGGSVGYHVFPHVQSNIPGYFVLDNTVIFDILFQVFANDRREENGITLDKSGYRCSTDLQKYHAWSTLFNFDHRVLKEETKGKKKFAYFARCNGKCELFHIYQYFTKDTFIIGHCIDLLFRKDIPAGLVNSETPRERYVHEMHVDQLEKTVVSIDPG